MLATCISSCQDSKNVHQSLKLMKCILDTYNLTATDPTREIPRWKKIALLDAEHDIVPTILNELVSCTVWHCGHVHHHESLIVLTTSSLHRSTLNRDADLKSPKMGLPLTQPKMWMSYG